MRGSGRQASREPDHKHPAWETNEKNWERTGRQIRGSCLGEKRRWFMRKSKNIAGATLFFIRKTFCVEGGQTGDAHVLLNGTL